MGSGTRMRCFTVLLVALVVLASCSTDTKTTIVGGAGGLGGVQAAYDYDACAADAMVGGASVALADDFCGTVAGLPLLALDHEGCVAAKLAAGAKDRVAAERDGECRAILTRIAAAIDHAGTGGTVDKGAVVVGP